MNLYLRDYLREGLSDAEKAEHNVILKKEKEGRGKFSRKNLYHEYSLAVRNCSSLFPNNHLDIYELKSKNTFIGINDKFHELIQSPNVSERDVLKYINKTPAFYLIGAILRGCDFRFGHHRAYLFPEFKLGTSYQADYLLVGKSSGGYEFVFVELENPVDGGREKVTLKNGELGRIFNKGISQVKDWRHWMQSNYYVLPEYFKRHKNKEKSLPDEFREYDPTRIHYVVVAGLRRDFTEKTYRIAREHKDSDKIHLLHYENLYDYGKKVLDEATF